MPTAQEYEEINICLYELGFILKKIGVTEFNISRDKRSVVWDTKQEIDSELLSKLCQLITSLYNKIK
jgi:hypothetical protein